MPEVTSQPFAGVIPARNFPGTGVVSNTYSYDFNRSSSSSSASKEYSNSRHSTNQALLYVGAFTVSHLPYVVVGILRASKVKVPFYVTIILALCYPLQGLLHFFVYFIPRYRLMKMNLGDSKSVFILSNGIWTLMHWERQTRGGGRWTDQYSRKLNLTLNRPGESFWLGR